MKKYIILLIAACGSASAVAQEPNSHEQPDYLVSRWVIDVNLMGGLGSQNFTSPNTQANYPNALNMNTGSLNYEKGLSYGGDAQLGFYFGKMRHFGIGTGFMYMGQHGEATLSSYHTEYQSTDGNGNIYRQVVNSSNVKEVINSSNINIPVLLKYKTRFSKHWGFSTDAGVLINLQMKNNYSTNASFDYEAIYKFQNTGDAGRVSVYDNSPVASAGDWFVTRKEFLQNNPNGNYLDYVNAERAAGINVGQGMSPGKRTGSTSYTQGSLGLLLQPSFNYYLSDYVALNLGVYYMIQPFKNSAQSGYRLENGIGTYSSVLNNVTASTNQDYGINIGAKFFFRKKEQKPLVITSIDHKSTSDCKLCDGSFTLHGLTPNEPVTVDYSFNGGTISSNTSTVQADGQVNVSHLCAGNYTDISAVIYKQKANGKPLTISDPMLAIVSQIPSNPSAAGCDGSLKIFGLGAGKSATVSYQRNGVLQTSYTAIVNSDNSINLVGLCEGKYTGIEAAVGNCTVSAADFVLTAPVAAPAPIRDIVEEEIDISTPILFDFNQSTIHISSYPQLNEASKQLIEKGDLYIRIDAHTDSKGSNEYNQKLSERRALSVKTYLKGKGANTAKISMHGHGKTEPAASNDTDEGRSKNRRAIMTKTIKL